MKKVLVTGGAGFIASHIVDRYIKEGHKVLIIDNLSSGKIKNINPKAEFLKSDINDKNILVEKIKEFRPQVVNHHAAHILVGNSVKYPATDATINILGLINIIEASLNPELEKIIMASTGGAIYGEKKIPFNENMKEQPLSPYGISKKAGELYLYFYYKQYKIPFIILRYANVYGPRQNAHGESGVIAVFSDLINKNLQPIINGDGTNTRDYVFVKDVVNANLLALNSNYCGIMNIGTNTEISTNEVLEKIKKYFNKKVKKIHGQSRPGEQIRSCLSYKKAKKILNWQPDTNFDEGIKKTIEWYKNEK